MASIPAVVAMKGRYEARGLRVLGVSEVDAEDLAAEKPLSQKTAEENKMTYPTFFDVGSEWQKSAKLESAPAFAVVDREGKIRYQHRGKLVEGEEAYNKLAAAVEEALGK